MWRSFVYTKDGEWRAPWRLLFFTGALVFFLFAANAIVASILSTITGAMGLGPVRGDSWSFAAGVLAAHWLTLRVEGRPWRDVALDESAARPAMLARGFAIGLAVIVVPIALLIAVGWLDRIDSGQGSMLAAAVRVTLVLLPAAFAEELLMRGYFFAVLRKAWSPVAALVVTSVVFGLMHIQNAGASATSVAYVVVAGLFLGTVLLTTRSLYAAWMAHFAFNWGMVVLFHTAVSGMPMEAPGYRYVDAGPDWATGGEWGPEAGLPAGAGMIGAIAYLHARRRRRQES